jgi:amidase
MTLREEEALAEATKADEARVHNKRLGRLHGLPVSIKDAFATAGIRTTAGSKSLENLVPKEDAVAVAKLRQSGVVIVGKTSLPEFSADIQSFNELAGTTNNPWDITRTCGGSTGGGAAAIASGFSYLELGSDSGGSIRIPAHFCGVFGHKSTVHLVSRVGWIPPLPGEFRGPNDWSIAGPLARSADDLKLMLEIVAGPVPDEAVAYQWSLPAPRAKTLREHRIGFVLNDAFCPLAPETEKVHAAFLDQLRRAGARLTEGWPKPFDPRRNGEVFRFLTTAFQASTMSEAQRRDLEGELNGLFAGHAKETLAAVRSTYEEWERHYVERLKFRRVWREYFRAFDAFLSPVAILPAFRHDHSQPRYRRLLDSAAGQRAYNEMFPWITSAGLSGCPATIVPIGLTDQGLPVGLQVIGPFLEDATPIHLASLLSELTGGFHAPPLGEEKG